MSRKTNELGLLSWSAPVRRCHSSALGLAGHADGARTCICSPRACHVCGRAGAWAPMDVQVPDMKCRGY